MFHNNNGIAHNHHTNNNPQIKNRYCTECELDNIRPDDVDGTLESEQNDGMGSLLGGLAGSPDGRMARVQAEYHNMRRERNRVLKQWQQERRVVSLSGESGV